MKRFLLIFTALFSVFACTKSDETYFVPTDDASQEPALIVVQERDPTLPAEPSRIGSLAKKSVAENGFIQSDDFIGRAYKIGNTILGDPENFSIPVFQRLKLKTDYPGYFTNTSLMKTEINYFAYTTDEEYEAKTNVTNKVSSGFKLNLGLFSIGRKKKMEQSFSTYDYQRTRDAYGELNIEFRRALYALRTSSLVNKRIAGEYLTPIFIELLYGQTIDETLAMYGTFVATGYHTGGRASSLYLGRDFTLASATERTRGMASEIEASFTWSDSGANGNLNYGNKNSCSQSQLYRFQSVYMTLSTIGGKPSYIINMSAQDIRGVFLNLAGWLSSLNDERTHTVIGFLDGGLQPLSDFILEENFRKRIQDTHLGIVHTAKQQLPSIEVVQAKETNALNGVQGAYSVLNTRHHDRLLLKGNNVRRVSGGSSSGLNKPSFGSDLPIITVPLASLSSIETSRRSKYFGLQISVNSEIKPVLSLALMSPAMFDCDFVLKNWNESEMVKFVNKDTRMIYLLNQKEKYALAFPDDDYTVDVYGIRAWVESMPEVVLLMRVLENDYTVYGL